MHKLACPKCHQALIQEGNSYKCINNHCYDIAKSKYINLLLNPDKASNNPGDSKESLQARKAYLTKGYYDIILNNVISLINKYQNNQQLEILDLGCGEGYYDGILNEVMHCLTKYTSSPRQLLDLGCGEGYYTYRIKELLNDDSTIYGLDISKEAINMATKYTKDIYWIVGNSKNIPILDHSLDFITALFTVVNQKELERTLKPGGYIIHVTANPNHLIEIKELIYDEIKVKSDKYIRLDFKNVESFDLVKTIEIPNREDALNLLKMTPHYYHIKKERRSVLDTLDKLNVTIDVKITVYQV